MALLDIKSELVEILQTKQKNESEGRERKAGFYYASEALQCPRKIYLNIIEPVEQDFPLGLFAMAKACEAQIVGTLKEKYGMLVETQTRIDVQIDDFRLHGYSDILLRNEKRKVIWIGEVKSASTYALKHRRAENKPSNHHRAQLHCYLNFLKCMEGAVIYVDRGDITNLEQYNDSLDMDLFDTIVDHFKLVHRHVKDENIPPPIPVEAWECGYCPHSKSCTEDRKGQYKRDADSIIGWVKE